MKLEEILKPHEYLKLMYKSNAALVETLITEEQIERIDVELRRSALLGKENVFIDEFIVTESCLTDRQLNEIQSYIQDVTGYSAGVVLNMCNPGKYSYTMCMNPFVEDDNNEEKVTTVKNTPSMKSLAELEASYIPLVMEAFKGNKTQVAKALGISIKTLYDKLDEYNIHTS